MASDQETALIELIESLELFMDEEEPSDPQHRPEVINSGHYVHDAVMEVETFYRCEKLPAVARVVWMDLLQITRGKRETNRPHQEAMQAAMDLSRWAESEIERISKTECKGGEPDGASGIARFTARGRRAAIRRR